MGIRARVLALTAAFALSGCAAEVPDPKPNLFFEYTQAVDVETDR